MAWQVKVMPKAQKRLDRMPQKTALRIVDALEAMQTDPFAQDMKRLQGRNEWRLRVGPWRVILRILDQELVILALDIGPRGDVYK